MKERPILMNGAMVRATLDGSKTQTRRTQGLDIVNQGHCDLYEYSGNGMFRSLVGAAHQFPKCPYGQIGDQLWVRETWRIGAWNEDEGELAIDYLADGFSRREWIQVPEKSDFERYWIQCTDDAMKAGLKTDDDGKYHWEPGQSPCRGRPSIHMPRWASRINLEITNVRIERLQGISAADAMAEGIKRTPVGNLITFEVPGTPIEKLGASAAYCALWESINGPGSWDVNPWVWCIEFKQVKE